MQMNVKFTTTNMEKEFLREISNDKATPKQNKVSEHNDLYEIDEDQENLIRTPQHPKNDPITLNEF